MALRLLLAGLVLAPAMALLDVPMDQEEKAEFLNWLRTASEDEIRETLGQKRPEVHETMLASRGRRVGLVGSAKEGEDSETEAYWPSVGRRIKKNLHIKTNRRSAKDELAEDIANALEKEGMKSDEAKQEAHASFERAEERQLRAKAEERAADLEANRQRKIEQKLRSEKKDAKENMFMRFFHRDGKKEEKAAQGKSGERKLRLTAQEEARVEAEDKASLQAKVEAAAEAEATAAAEANEASKAAQEASERAAAAHEVVETAAQKGFSQAEVEMAREASAEAEEVAADFVVKAMHAKEQAEKQRNLRAEFEETAKGLAERPVEEAIAENKEVKRGTPEFEKKVKLMTAALKQVRTGMDKGQTLGMDNVMQKVMQEQPMLAAEHSEGPFYFRKEAEAEKAHKSAHKKAANYSPMVLAANATINLLRAQDRAGRALQQLGISPTEFDFDFPGREKLELALESEVQNVQDAQAVLDHALTADVSMNNVFLFIRKQKLVPSAQKSFNQFIQTAHGELPESAFPENRMLFESEPAVDAVKKGLNQILESGAATNIIQGVISARSKALKDLAAIREASKKKITAKTSFGQAMKLWRLVRQQAPNITGADGKEFGQLWKSLAGPTKGSPDCKKEPLKPYEYMSFAKKITVGGRPQLRSWCYGAPFKPPTSRMSLVAAQTVQRECLIKKDPKKSAQQFYDQQVKAGLGEMEASYCFLAGHCDDKDISEDDADEYTGEQVCDMRYGGWRNMGFKDVHEKQWAKDGSLTKAGLRNQTAAAFWAAQSCAMGSLHCDIVACKMTFCKNDYYTRKAKIMADELNGLDESEDLFR